MSPGMNRPISWSFRSVFEEGFPVCDVFQFLVGNTQRGWSPSLRLSLCFLMLTFCHEVRNMLIGIINGLNKLGMLNLLMRQFHHTRRSHMTFAINFFHESLRFKDFARGIVHVE